MIAQPEMERKIADICRRADAVCEHIADGVAQYREIRAIYARHGPLDMKDFYPAFRQFYRLRGVFDAEALKAMIAARKKLAIETAIERLACPSRPCVNISFASKVLHTIDNDLPIFDHHVGNFFGCGVTGKGWAARLRSALRIYGGLKEMYRDREKNGLIRLAEAFSARFGDDFSEVKKIDFMIWGAGR